MAVTLNFFDVHIFINVHQGFVLVEGVRIDVLVQVSESNHHFGSVPVPVPVPVPMSAAFGWNQSSVSPFTVMPTIMAITAHVLDECPKLLLLFRIIWIRVHVQLNALVHYHIFRPLDVPFSFHTDLEVCCKQGDLLLLIIFLFPSFQALGVRENMEVNVFILFPPICRSRLM